GVLVTAPPCPTVGRGVPNADRKKRCMLGALVSRTGMGPGLDNPHRDRCREDLPALPHEAQGDTRRIRFPVEHDFRLYPDIGMGSSFVNALLIPIGSRGDLHPFLGLGLALQASGHRVKMITNDYFAPLVRRLGLEFVELGDAEWYRESLNSSVDWDTIRGFKIFVAEWVQKFLRPLFETVPVHYIPGETVV